ncbi:hypothetical protein B0O99DRAFT_299677 [Bisporella sp. PMI_857]|nr:hypothetical protein B0O99DRAFT_299677 [Bisporella sp. PMI_857]
MSNAEENAVIGSVMGNENSTPADEGAPMPPPKELPEWRAAAPPAANLSNSTPSPAPGPPRLKKKVPWKGKNILVLLPWDDERGLKGNAPTPLTDKDLEAMMTEWQQKGYNTGGFDLGHERFAHAEGGPGQSRGVWPETADIVRERQDRNYRISIPDRREWDAYVQELAEAKLRALGVSFGDEDPPVPSPVPSGISRRTSMQYPSLPFSPPIPTNSAGSMSQHPNIFSPPLISGPGLSASQSSNTNSVASPASMHAQLQGKFNPRQSVSFSGGEHPFGSPFQYPQQPSPGVWSPQQMLYQQGGARGGSPSLQNLGAIASPGSPFLPEGYFQQGDVAAQMQQRQHMLQNQLHQQQQLQLGARASPRLAEVSEIDETMSKSPSKTPEARQFRHNPSASLQKEIDDAEYHLEEQFQRQLEHEDYSPHSEKANEEDGFEKQPLHARNPSNIDSLAASRFPTLEDSDDGPTLHHPQPHSRGHSLSQQPFQDSEDVSSAESKSGYIRNKDLSDIDTIPSNLGTPTPDLSNSRHVRAVSMSSNPWADTESNGKPRGPGHSSKPSTSTLNVAAKEFKFDPAKAFSSNAFAFGNNSFQPALGAQPAFGPGPISSTSSHFSNQSISSGKGKINVAAPVFTPGQSEFSFSASGPTFRPDAPAFTPSFNSNFASSVGSTGSGSEGPRSSSIFGGIDLSALGITKPSKKNAAIPIVRPDSSHSRSANDETIEGKDGRITQGEGRIKRARGVKDDRDSVPLFAPSMPLSETSREQSPPKDAQLPTTTVADKENSAPLSDDQAAVANPPAKSHSRSVTAESVEQKDKEFTPFEFEQPKQAAEFNAARPFTSRRYASGLPGYGFYSPSEDEKATFEERDPEPVKKQHKKNVSSLSATAKPFEYRPGTFSSSFGQNEQPEPTHALISPISPITPVEESADVLEAPAASVSPVTSVAPNEPVAPVARPAVGGLANSRWARSPTPPAAPVSPEVDLQPEELPSFQAALPRAEVEAAIDREESDREPTFEEIDAVMRQLKEIEMESGPTPHKNPSRDEDISRWHQPSPTRRIQVPEIDSSPIRLQPQNLMRSDAPSPSPARFRALPGESRIFSRVHDDPFVVESPAVLHVDSQINRRQSLVVSDWDDVLSDGEAAKLQPRARFFDGRVNDLVGGLLEHRLNPLEKALEAIQLSIESMATRAPSSRRARRSFSGALSDADDEDDDADAIRRSMSPRRDRKMDKIRAIVTEALAAHQSRPQTASSASAVPVSDSQTVLSALEEMKAQFGQTMRLDLRGEDLRSIVEEAVQARMPTPKPDDSVLLKTDLRSIVEEVVQSRIPAPVEKDDAAVEAANLKEAETQSRITDLEERLRRAEISTEEEVQSRRAAEDRLAENQRLLRISTEEEMRLRERMEEQQSQINGLEERLSLAAAATEQEILNRRAVEDRLSENQRLLRISTEEEMRLRESMEEREVKIRAIVDESDAKVRHAEDTRAKATMRMALLEANQDNSQKNYGELTNRLAMVETELRQARQETQRWQMDAERALEAARRHSEDAEQANETNKELRRTIDSLRTQTEESIRVREGMRGMLTGLQEDMAIAARNISQENAQRAKKEAELVARQEVLDARLQAEARTRERLEMEIERLENGEREGMRAVSEAKRLEQLVAELRQESHISQKDALKFQREFEEARESGLAEVHRTRIYMQAEIESANNQVNIVRNDLEAQISRLRNELDQVKLDSDTARAKHEMLLESSESSKKEIEDGLRLKHANELEDIQARHERDLNNALEDAQRQEQHLLERLSLSSSKAEHLQDRVSHLEEKLEIAKSAANAAVVAAKGARSMANAPAQAVPAQIQQTLSKAAELPEKISPQALRESIMVLQEQLQDREQNIERLEAKVASLDPDASTKIQKRDDEIIWLRELLAVRKSDLTDIVITLESDQYDPEQVKDAAIRLRANLQMEEQERERAMNGGSAINLPNIAASLRDAASPRVAQAVGPLAAAWGNWRKGRTDSSLSEAVGSTPSRNNSPSGSFLNGLLTPPASQLRTPPGGAQQPNQRFSAAQLANRPRNMTPRAREKQPMRGSPRKAMGTGSAAPSTPPMMRKSSYDADARAEDFSDAGFYDDDESIMDDSIYGGKLR